MIVVVTWCCCRFPSNLPPSSSCSFSSRLHLISNSDPILWINRRKCIFKSFRRNEEWEKIPLFKFPKSYFQRLREIRRISILSRDELNCSSSKSCSLRIFIPNKITVGRERERERMWSQDHKDIQEAGRYTQQSSLRQKDALRLRVSSWILRREIHIHVKILSSSGEGSSASASTATTFGNFNYWTSSSASDSPWTRILGSFDSNSLCFGYDRRRIVITLSAIFSGNKSKDFPTSNNSVTLAIIHPTGQPIGSVDSILNDDPILTTSSSFCILDTCCISGGNQPPSPDAIVVNSSLDTASRTTGILLRWIRSQQSIINHQWALDERIHRSVIQSALLIWTSF